MATVELVNGTGQRVGEIVRPDGYDMPSVVVYGTAAFVLGIDGKYHSSAFDAVQAVRMPWPRRNQDGF